SSRNVWVSGLSSNTKAAALKNLFGKHGKVLSAKVVTNARSPGSKCYGLVTMSSSADVTRCISHLDSTELHGQKIFVSVNDPFKKEGSKKEAEVKTSSNKPSDKRTSTATKMTNKIVLSHKKEDKHLEKNKDSPIKQEVKSGKSESSTSPSPSIKDDRKHESRRREITEHEHREREERENLFRERQRLEMERQKLERERLERERLERERVRIEQERRKEAERILREREELRRQQEQLRYEQEKRNHLKRGREMEHGRNRFDGEPEEKKRRLAPHRDNSGFERYPKNFESVRRAEPPHSSRAELHDTDRRDREERRPVSMHERHMGARATMQSMSNHRSGRDGEHGWKNEGSMSKGDVRGPMRMRTERSGSDGPGPSVRGGPSSSRGRSNFGDRDGKPMSISSQPFSSGRQVVVERHSRDSGLRKEWQSGSNSQDRAFADNRRMEGRGSLMGSSSHSSSGLNRIVQITSNSIPSGGNTGGFKSYKGTPRQY
ncbi:unnamed protein product, partial [Tetraodon nigroviridis]